MIPPCHLIFIYVYVELRGIYIRINVMAATTPTIQHYNTPTNICGMPWQRVRGGYVMGSVCFSSDCYALRVDVVWLAICA